MPLGSTFHETEEQRLLRASVADFVARENPPARLRAVRELPDGFDRARLRQVGRLGWIRLALPEAQGGLGLGHGALAALHEELGRGAMPEPVAALALAAGALAAARPDVAGRWLPGVLDGEALVALAWQGAAGALGAADCGCTAVRTPEGYRLDGQACFVPAAHAPDLVLVAARLEGGIALFALPPAAAGLSLQLRRAADFSVVGALQLVSVQVSAAALAVAPAAGGGLIDGLLDRARLAAAAETAGAMARTLDMTLDYLRVREQFGKPIGAFQALQHRAVDLYMQLELGRAAVAAAAQALDAGAPDAPLRVAACKARCSDAAIQLGARAVHLHGAIGITEEYDLGLYIRRMHFLSAWLGNGDGMRRRYAALARRQAQETPA